MKVLITGATGLVGKILIQELQKRGHQVSILSRGKSDFKDVETFQWDLKNNYLNPDSLKETEAVIHLAGAGVADKSWTKERKKEIMDSRIDSAKLLLDKMKEFHRFPKIFISASAIGYYGNDTGGNLLSETSQPGNDFLAQVCIEWEKSADQFQVLGLRVAKIRIGVVLSKEGGAYPKIAQPIKLGLGSALGSGKQFISWIHIQDLCAMFVYALENESIQGAYNAVAPNPVTNEELTRTIAKVLQRPLLLPHVPSFALQFALGEMASIVLGGNNVSSEKIQQAGYTFLYPDLENALKSLV